MEYSVRVKYRHLTFATNMGFTTMINYQDLTWKLTSYGDKDESGQIITILAQIVTVHRGSSLLHEDLVYDAQKPGTELQEWFAEQGVHEILVWQGRAWDVFEIKPPERVGVLARLTFPSRRER